MHMTQSTAAVLVLFGLASLFLLCITIPLMYMATTESGTPCSMEHATAVCPMTIHAHLGFWQEIVLPLSLLIPLVLVAFSLQDVVVLEAARRLSFRRYTTDVPPPLFDYLKQAFSQGILHPKIY
jgi:hypothetical protein